MHQTNVDDAACSAVSINDTERAATNGESGTYISGGARIAMHLACPCVLSNARFGLVVARLSKRDPVDHTIASLGATPLSCFLFLPLNVLANGNLGARTPLKKRREADERICCHRPAFVRPPQMTLAMACGGGWDTLSKIYAK